MSSHQNNDRGPGGGRGRSNRGAGRGRGQGHGQEQIERGSGRGRSRGQGEESNGRGRGRRDRGRGGFTDEMKDQIVAKRPTASQISSDGTDDIIVAAAASKDLLHMASFLLKKEDFISFGSQRQMRTFVNSCLINLSNHHTIDTSAILMGLASPSGIKRLSEIMTRSMCIDAGTNRDKISVQYVILPFIGVLTRERVCQTTMVAQSNAIYSTVFLHYQTFLEDGVLRCMDMLLDRGSLQDPSISLGMLQIEDPFVCVIPSFQCALLGIVRLVYQVLNRIRDARLAFSELVGRLQEQVARCSSMPVTTPEDRFINEILVFEMSRIVKIANEAQGILQPLEVATAIPGTRPQRFKGPNMVHLRMYYDPPGELSESGPRHDNDFDDISEISVIPTRDEVTSPRLPFLPSNGAPDAPHFLAPGWKKQLDIHFRLYREDMMDPLRRSMMAFLKLLDNTSKANEDQLLRQREIRKNLDDNVNLNVYGNVQFLGLQCNKKKQASVVISFSQPTNLQGQSVAKRTEFWERSKSRLMQGGLVGVVARSGDSNDDTNITPAERIHMLLGVVTERDSEVMAKKPDSASISISLTDPNMYPLMIKAASEQGQNARRWFLVESPGVFFESYRPILKALQSCTPASMPLGRYLAPTQEEDVMNLEDGRDFVKPPLYTHAPGFTFDLSVVLKNRGLQCQLDVMDPVSIRLAVNTLQQHSTLDDTQASALVQTLCREVALISGPPGTGKTKIGVDLMRVLLHNKPKMHKGPILCICYTNHALDQFLEHLLDEGITSIVRAGARSKSERLQDYNLESLRYSTDRSFNVRCSIREAEAQWHEVKDDIERLEQALRSDILSWDFVRPFLMRENPLLAQQIASNHSGMNNYEPEDEDGFTTVGKNTRLDPYVRWAQGHDLQATIKWNRSLTQSKPKAKKQKNKFAVLQADRNDDERVPDWNNNNSLLFVPKSNRPLELLDSHPWDMSLIERLKLLGSWREEIQAEMMHKLEGLLRTAEQLSKKTNDAYDDMRREILCAASVIGMTTNGAAKFQPLIESVAPRIIICEEAGEVLESHVLAALSSSTQHLILIGDHLQLRPQIATYELSSDSPKGRNYNLDQSLFERLVTSTRNPLPLSHLTIQRRMRPEISSLIRNTLYPNLVDGKRVLEYPNVSGMGSNLFFMDHCHGEDAKDQYGLQSFSNTFEVRMVESLAHYLIKNGYNQKGDIAVLTPYLGQLSKLREHLKNSFMLVIDERDREQLEQSEVDRDAEISSLDVINIPGQVNKIEAKNVSIQSYLTLRTIDNYQGEEAKVIIISLVRNETRPDGSTSENIGFLKSPNRTNVLLSRAQHGMYLIGNANLMAHKKHGMWPKVIEELRENDRVGEGFPIVCKNHPELVNVVDSPEMLKIVAPHGGCNSPCGHGMSCGHVCPLQCHPDDPEHRLIKCHQPCPRLQPVCLHVCPRECGENCGDCQEIVAPMLLPCGHVIKRPKCHQKKNRSKIICHEKTVRKSVSCEHEQTIECWQDVASIRCMVPCRGVVAECNHPCARACSDCQSLSLEGLTVSEREVKRQTLVKRTAHGRCRKLCDKPQFCGHSCPDKCHLGSNCQPCKKACVVRCAHSKCNLNCDVPCAACCEACTWECEHQGKCELPCGAPCSRLPCNKRCEKILKCGHQCVSVCGEKCPSKDFCTECEGCTKKDMIVDMIMQSTLGEADLFEDPLMVLSCGHAFTMSSMDGIMEMNQYYTEVLDPLGGPSTFKTTSNLPNEEVPQKQCPNCRVPILGLARYGRRIKYAQLAMRLKKHQTLQARVVAEAQEQLPVAVALMMQKEQEVAEVFTRFKAADQKTPPPSAMRTLGKFRDDQIMFPRSNVLNLKAYGLPKEHANAWGKIVRPAMRSLDQFMAIHNTAVQDPTRQLFEATVSHLYRAKSLPNFEAANVSEETAIEIEDDKGPASDKSGSTPLLNRPLREEVLRDCICECGLPADGYAGSSYVDSLFGMANALEQILVRAASILDRVSILSGWNWFVQDLMDCVLGYVKITMEAMEEGKHGRKIACTRVMKMDVLRRCVQWIARQSPVTDQADRKARLDKVDEYTAEFMKEMREILERCPLGIKDECVQKAKDAEEKMVLAIKQARGQAIYSPVSDQEKFQLFSAMQSEIGGTGHWYRCPNGHTYVIGECGRAMQQSRCPECHAVVGGRSHNLQEGNTHDEEFERIGTRGAQGLLNRLEGLMQEPRVHQEAARLDRQTPVNPAQNWHVGPDQERLHRFRAVEEAARLAQLQEQAQQRRVEAERLNRQRFLEDVARRGQPQEDQPCLIQ